MLLVVALNKLEWKEKEIENCRRDQISKLEHVYLTEGCIVFYGGGCPNITWGLFIFAYKSFTSCDCNVTTSVYIVAAGKKIMKQSCK